MTPELLADNIELTELANKLFMYTDAQHWQQLQEEVFASTIHFDMTSAGGSEPTEVEAKNVCGMWEEGFQGLDAVHHQAGHYLITVKNNEADIFGYAIAMHYKAAASYGNTRSYVGSYDLKAQRTSRGWRLSQFKYNLKFIDGNTTLE